MAHRIQPTRQSITPSESAQACIRRSRAVYLGLLGATIVLGLGSRKFGTVLPVFLARYAGDTLWASMVLWLLALVWPGAKTRRLAISAAVIALSIELSQLYQAHWIDAIRATRLGALVLGRGFLWSDLACYAVGVGLAALVDRRLANWVFSLKKEFTFIIGE